MTLVREVVIGRLHVITDEVLQNRYSHAELARLAIAGGADAVQYREKRALLTIDLVTCARAVAQECRAGAAACIVDDRVDVAVAAEADGVHVGRNDIEATIARKLVGNGFLIGGTANSLAEARVVFRTPVDYIGVGPVFGTNSKANPAPVLGLDALREIVAESPVPIIAIGNITPEAVSAVLATGAHGIAVLSGITCAPDPTTAAKTYADAIRTYLATLEEGR